MDNSQKIRLIKEEDVHRAVFVTPREEAGINSEYDPELGQYTYQVFIHNCLPLTHKESWFFHNYSEAIEFAAKKFDKDWEFLYWNQMTNRPCEQDGKSCGSDGGGCSSDGGGCGSDGGGCGSGGGGCSTCGATDDNFAD